MTEEDNEPGVREAASGIVSDKWEDEYERPRGTLTDTDRRFLWGLIEYEHETTAANRRKEIRKRMENGILDLSYLRRLNKRDRTKVFNAVAKDSKADSLEGAVSALIEFVYSEFNRNREAIGRMVARGIDNAESEPGTDLPHRGGVKEVTVDIEIDRDYDVEAIYERYAAGEGHLLTPAEIGVLVRDGRLDATDLEELGANFGEFD